MNHQPGFIMLKIFLFIISLTFYFSNLYSQTENRSFITDSLDAYVEEALTTWQIPGIAVCVVKDGEVVLSKGYGVREAGKDDKVDENTLFMIGSNTKAFTGTALALLEHDGKLSMDDKVQKYLPDFTMKDPWVAKELNLTDIVSHRMGMETFQGDFMYWTSDLTMDKVIQKFGQLTPTYGFRTKWGYTNAGYAIAGKIIEKVSGKS
ncbi:MAG: class A beta-lactamase-related serine hydrolase, partial [Ignavibacteriales bacterium]